MGAGSWGRNHAKALAELGALGGVHDLNRQAAAAVAEQYKCELVEEISQEATRGYDFAVVATPASTHFEVALRLIHLGLHVLVEKPLTTSYSEAVRLVEEARRKGVRLGVGYIELFNPAVMAILEEASGGAFSASAFRINIRPQRITDVGVVLDTMIHDINIANRMLGDSRLSLSSVIRDNGVDVFARAYLEGAGGLKGVMITAAWTGGARLRKWTIAFREKAVEADLISKTVTSFSGGAESSRRFESSNALLDEDRHFIEGVEKGVELVNDASQALRDMLIATALLGVNA